MANDAIKIETVYDTVGLAAKCMTHGVTKHERKMSVDEMAFTRPTYAPKKHESRKSGTFNRRLVLESDSEYSADEVSFAALGKLRAKISVPMPVGKV